MVHTLPEIKDLVLNGVDCYNSSADPEKSIVRIDLFGSYANGAASEKSDIDLLVEFSTPHVGLFALAAVLQAMEDATSMQVDVVQAPLPADSLLVIERTVPLYAST